jgi:hypothetical protein
MNANCEHRDQAGVESELFHKVRLTPPIKHHKRGFVASFDWNVFSAIQGHPNGNLFVWDAGPR